MGRRLGQHFLADHAILDRIVEALNPEASDVVLEIGAGTGTLTRRLADRVRLVVAIERDRELASGLRRDLESEPDGGDVTVVHGDALTLDWHHLISSQLSEDLDDFKVIGNIPYYITTPLIEKALAPPLPRVVVYLLQDEVARRLASAPGSREYGALSVGVQVVARVDSLFRVRAGSFRPAPEVDSVLVRITPLASPLVPVPNRAAFRIMVTRFFSQRRKQLVRSARDVFNLPRNRVLAVLEEARLPPGTRPEMLSPLDFVRLFEVAALTREPRKA